MRRPSCSVSPRGLRALHADDAVSDGHLIDGRFPPALCLRAQLVFSFLQHTVIAFELVKLEEIYFPQIKSKGRKFLQKKKNRSYFRLGF